MEIVAKAKILSMAKETKTKETVKGGTGLYRWGTAMVIGAQGKGLVVSVIRTLLNQDGVEKSEVHAGDEVTLYGDTDRTLTSNGKKFIPFEVSTSVETSSVEDIAAAFGVEVEKKAEVVA